MHDATPSEHQNKERQLTYHYHSAYLICITLATLIIIHESFLCSKIISIVGFYIHVFYNDKCTVCLPLTLPVQSGEFDLVLILTCSCNKEILKISCFFSEVIQCACAEQLVDELVADESYYINCHNSL